jgi:type II secretory pathway pseudopilin PulG
MTRNPTTRRRAAFTLVELMVSAAVCVLIMAIITQAFVLSTTTMRELKAVGDMQDQLRAAAFVMRDDLQQDHFSPDDNRPNLGLKLSDQRLDDITPVGPRITGWTPPPGGFFRARSTPSFIEGYDNDNLGSYRVPGDRFSHYLHFTSVRPGGLDQNVYSATIGTGTISSRAAEIAYFLDPAQQGVTDAGGIPYFNLIRRQRLVALTDFDTVRVAVNDPTVVSVYTNALGQPAVNTMATITNPANRLGGRRYGLFAEPIGAIGAEEDNLSRSPGRVGDDVLLSYVTSFEVKLQWVAAAPGLFGPRSPRGFLDPTRPGDLRPAGQYDAEAPTGPGSLSTDFPLDSLPQQSTNRAFLDRFTFDTWSTAVNGWDANRQPVTAGQAEVPNSQGAIPLRCRVLKAKITIRVWDPKLKLSRQMTIVQDL